MESFTDTTRPPRKSEEDGKEYHFISTEEMTRNISANEFLEFGSYQGNMFGTKFETVHQIHKQDKIAILDIEPQVGRHGEASVYGFSHTRDGEVGLSRRKPNAAVRKKVL